MVVGHEDLFGKPSPTSQSSTFNGRSGSGRAGYGKPDTNIGRFVFQFGILYCTQGRLASRNESPSPDSGSMSDQCMYAEISVFINLRLSIFPSKYVCRGWTTCHI